MSEPGGGSDVGSSRAGPDDARDPGMAAERTTAQDTKAHLALALDVDDLVEAQRLARRLRPWFDIAKVGLELFAAAGPESVSALAGEGYAVFLDLKLHDIPTTAGHAARVVGGLGCDYLTVHTAGGRAMVSAAVEGARTGAAAAGIRGPRLVAVTVLTSDPAASPELVTERCEVAVDAGCNGVVCAASDLAVIRRQRAGLFTVVPGVRPEGTTHDDQARISTPAQAVAAGADILVVGRAVTAAHDQEAAAASVHLEVTRALSAPPLDR